VGKSTFLASTAAVAVGLGGAGTNSGSDPRVPPGLAKRELAFVRSSGRDHLVHIYVARPDGSRMRRLADGPGCKQRPMWSPNGRKIAYRFEPACDYNHDQVVVIDVSTGRRSNISRKTGVFGNSPSWSPDAKRIAFAGIRNAHGRPAANDLPGGLYIARSDGSSAARVTPRSLGEVQYPTWSPDGKWIAFQISRPQGFDIYRVDPRGKHLRQLTHSGELGVYNEWPMWSPDSRRIAYGVEGQASSLWVMRADGTGAHKIWSGIGVPANWAPGAWLVANCGRGICALSPDGARRISLLRGADSGFPAWRP
jgi:Tol biopolymer transport system component